MRTCHIGNVGLSDDVCRICVPFFGRTPKETADRAKEADRSGADLLEWRADYMESVRRDEQKESDEANIRQMQDSLAGTGCKTPVIFTYRTRAEGGEGEREGLAYIRLLKAASGAGFAAVDVELQTALSAFDGQEEVCRQMIRDLQCSGARVIVSAHFFKETPEDPVMEKLFDKMERLGADVAKLAVMPHDPGDVLRLMAASRRAVDRLSCPVITMSMGEIGMLTRIGGVLTGSAVTFASAGQVSAPGQLTVGQVRQALAWLGGEKEGSAEL